MRKVKVQKTEQFTFAAVDVKAVEIPSDKLHELVIAMPLLPKWDSWRAEVLARPVSAKEVSAK